MAVFLGHRVTTRSHPEPARGKRQVAVITLGASENPAATTMQFHRDPRRAPAKLLRQRERRVLAQVPHADRTRRAAFIGESRAELG